MEKGDIVIDLEQIDSLRGDNVIDLRSEKAEENSTDDETQVDNSEELSDNLVQEVTPVVDGEGLASIYIEVDKETGGIKRILSVEGKEVAALPPDDARWSGNGIGGPGSVMSFPDSVCKSFKKRVTKFNALDQSEAVVVQEHWCALFEEGCPVIGATAKAPECLRNRRNSVTRAPEDTTITKTIREHVDDGPSNTFTTVLTRPLVVASEDSRTHSARIREQA